ncbi:MAG: hypothetical protein V5A62_00400 [Haloarculaceae archaeon]
MEDADGERADGPTWADLFERAAPHEVEESTVREALARCRGGR